MAESPSCFRALCFAVTAFAAVSLFWAVVLISVLFYDGDSRIPISTPDIHLSVSDFVIRALGLTVSVAAAVLVIWGPHWRLRLAGPKLRLQLVHPKGQLVDRDIPVRYYHVSVTNDRASYPAEECRVMLIDAVKADPSGTLASRGFPAPLQLAWPYPDLPGNNPLQKIGPSALRDLGSIQLGNPFKIATYARTDVFDLELAKGEIMQVKLVAVSMSGASAPLWIQIQWDGHWAKETGDMASHLVVRQILDRKERFFMSET